jgi:hypothetical protein
MKRSRAKMRMNYRKYFLILFTGYCFTLQAQNFTEILGRPENASVTVNALFDQAVQVYWEYGLTQGNYSGQTAHLNAQANVPVQTDLTGLQADREYYYRCRYRPSGSSGSYQTGTEHSFHTVRPAGATFSFAIEADPHMDTNSLVDAYNLTLQNILGKKPDFLLDLGDIFMSEKLPSKTQANITARHVLYRPLLGSVCHSVPLYLVLGNHEGECGWNGTGTSGSLATMAANTRKLYYANPLPDSFYSGDSIAEPFVGLRGNYYSWEWGDALFIVLDPYWYTSGTSHLEWGWTLGEAQYEWFSRVISQSNAKFKFIFCHQLVGGNGSDGRGGSEFAMYYENGGLNSDSTWGFTAHRPGWSRTVHELMLENRGSIFFHGHDHCYAKQPLDGLIYQEVPQPSSRNITTITGSQYGYKNGVLLPSRGFLLVTVSDSTAKVEYVRTFLSSEEKNGHLNGEVADSYTLRPGTAGTGDLPLGETNAGLVQNYPNPFKEGTSVAYHLEQPGFVSLSIYDMYGREVSAPVSAFQPAGSYTVWLDGHVFRGGMGLYYCRLTTGSYAKTIKMICTGR